MSLVFFLNLGLVSVAPKWQKLVNAGLNIGNFVNIDFKVMMPHVNIFII